MRKSALALAASLVLVHGPAGAEPGYGPAERALVTALFRVLQPRSVAAESEFCGYLYRDPAGGLRVSGPVAGVEGACTAPWPAQGTPLASFHTHGGYDADLWNELPSARDLQADAFEGVDGWVATPGGRLWHVDGAGMVAHLVCGPGCLPGDPDYDPGATGEIAARYTLDDLLDRFAEE
jgi:hypothetical protein